MVLHKRGLGRFVDADWHQFREHARKTSHSASDAEWSDQEQERYDLETAQINGSDHIDFNLNEPYEGEPFDVVEEKPRR